MGGKRALVFKMDGECIVCTSHAHNKDGYLRLLNRSTTGPRMKMYHRVTYEATHGAIPEGYEVDHICRNRGCQNINHLQLLKISEHKAKTNKERSDDFRAEAIKLFEEGIVDSGYISELLSTKRSTVNRWLRYWRKGK